MISNSQSLGSKCNYSDQDYIEEGTNVRLAFLWRDHYAVIPYSVDLTKSSKQRGSRIMNEYFSSLTNDTITLKLVDDSPKHQSAIVISASVCSAVTPRT
jgi:hypothetical protein